jgi:uncharacterized protein (TIGR03083 family)
VLIQPRYDGPPVIVLDGAIDDQRETLIRQRRRMVNELASLTDEEWRTLSRCEGWTTQDVVAHLSTTDDFWRLSIEAGLAGAPSRFLVGFDPRLTPAALVDAMQALSPAATFERFATSTRSLCDAVDALDVNGWATIAEAPPGHVPIRVIAHHALWDAWVHERDILLPLGVAPVEEADEIISCLRYAAALGPSFAALSDADRRGVLAIDVSDPDAHVVVELAGGEVAVRAGEAPPGAAVLCGRAVDVLEMLSIRAPFDQAIPDDARWMVQGLADVFESTAEAKAERGRAQHDR